MEQGNSLPRKKVFVSGCYDMLHSGHVVFFEEASKLGDLYVGLGSDSTIFSLKGRVTVNNNQERLYMVKALRCVKDAWINSGSGVMDFEKEVIALKPDIFFVNTDGFTLVKEKFCKEHGIQLVVSERIPAEGLPVRSTTMLREECHIPYRVELCGGWMDQPLLNNHRPGSVITMSIEPDYEFNERSGMATSSRKKAIELWKNQVPVGNPEVLARTLFCVENPPGTQNISGSQDQLGIMLPGINKLNYDRGFWPVSIESRIDNDTLNFVEENLWLLQLKPRENGYNVYENMNVNIDSIARLADATENAWEAILSKDIHKWGKATKDCFAAQLEMFPNMATPSLYEYVSRLKESACGWKLSGAGGGGYLILISDKIVPYAMRIRCHRADN